jgi:hypothetical protein
MTPTDPTGPIIIGGAGRSGTTLLRVMLDAHPRICCGPELKLLPSVAEWYQTMTGNFAAVMDSYRIAPADLRRCFRGFIEGLVDNFRRASGKPRWAEKTPHNIVFLGPLGELFPDARFLHVIRDGRDVVSSLVTMDWVNPLTGRKWDYVQNVASAARYWRDVIVRARQQAAQPALAGRVLEVRYEALVTDTEATLRRVLEFVGEPWDEALLAYHLRSRSHEPVEASTAQALKPVTRTPLGRWQTELTRLDRAAFKSEAGDLLKALGYAAGDNW